MAGQHQDDKARRLAAALRENLKRRKAQGRAQERGREEPAGAEAAPGEAHDSAPPVAGTTLSAEPDGS